MMDTPLLFIAFNRPGPTAVVFDALRKVAPAKLYVAIDGPRNNREDDLENCKKVKEIVKNIDWDCQVRYLERDWNLGCKKAVSGAIEWFFQYEEEGIILEDDCLPDPSFFTFCSTLLQKYRDNPRVLTIGGCNLGYKSSSPCSYGFTRYMNMWGWATWRSRAGSVDYEMTGWLKKKNKFAFLFNRLRDSILFTDFLWLQKWENIFNAVAGKKVDTWDYQWFFHAFQNQCLSVFPAKNLIVNLGFSADATHTVNLDSPLARLQLGQMETDLKHPPVLKNDKLFENKYIKKIWAEHKTFSLKTQLGFLFHKLFKRS